MYHSKEHISQYINECIDSYKKYGLKPMPQEHVDLISTYIRMKMTYEETINSRNDLDKVVNDLEIVLELKKLEQSK